MVQNLISIVIIVSSLIMYVFLLGTLYLMTNWGSMVNL